MKVYLPGDMTSAFGGVEKGTAKHMLAAIETANRYGIGLTPSCTAAVRAIGANKTAQAVLLINSVKVEVAK
ncbi:hypothetical protein D3C78_1060000 [compost metagenome]